MDAFFRVKLWMVIKSPLSDITEEKEGLITYWKLLGTVEEKEP